MAVLLLDGNNLAIRSHLAPKGEMSANGMETGTLVLFVNTLARYVKLERPTHALVAWDSGYSAYRTHIFPEYKANRKQKYSDDVAVPFQLLNQFLYLAGFPQLQLPGYEGDDIIYAAWRACRGRRQVRIISSDKDLFQMVGNGTEQLRLTSNHEKPDRWDRNRIITDLGYKPEHAVSVMALMGDKSDGIPGLPRVGPKTAIKMLRECEWDLDRLIEKLPADQQERVLVNLALIDLSVVPLDLDEPPELHLVAPGHPVWPKLMEFCDMYELNQIKAKLQTNTLWELNRDS